MIDTGLSKLYSPNLLLLATELHQFPLSDDFELRASGRSQTCGSTIDIGLATDGAGIITRIGVRVSACAVGQASCAILAKNAVGQTALQIARSRRAIADWLEGASDLPDWPEFDALKPAQKLTGRHGAILLPWNAAVEALSNLTSSS